MANWFLTVQESRHGDLRAPYNIVTEEDPVAYLTFRLETIQKNQMEGRDKGLKVILLNALQVEVSPNLVKLEDLLDI